jgi:hypothetical protein
MGGGWKEFSSSKRNYYKTDKFVHIFNQNKVNKIKFDIKNAHKSADYQFHSPHFKADILRHHQGNKSQLKI